MRSATQKAIGRRGVLGGALGIGAAALLPGAQAAVPAPALRRAPRVIAIDAGHGGRDPGAIGVDGTHEKVVTMAVARELARRIEAVGPYKVLLTRRRDEFIALEDRVRLARSGRAALFMSLHADSVPNHHTRGFSVYTLSEDASDDLAASLAKRENAADQIAGLDLARHSKVVNSILIDLMRRETSNSAITMASTVVTSLNPPLPPLDKPHREANFAVLRAPDIPSVLVEMGFLSNPLDERQLRDPRHQRVLAERLTRAINTYFESI